MTNLNPIKLTDDWLISQTRHIYLIRLDQDIYGYCKTQELAEALILSLGNGITEQLQKSKETTHIVTQETIHGIDGSPTKILIREQSLGYLRNGYPSVRHIITYSPSYKCYRKSEIIAQAEQKVPEVQIPIEESSEEIIEGEKEEDFEVKARGILEKFFSFLD